ncbi:hypothetical protein L1987_28401 [Smallanthus sonchifolius]|uniref:Uncharacterized protein n=1 Tax=Smallanthus sonchifolius TaxID=185202 RepID=A0ACB9HX56_9ASTR|nr:hypothetical protein L1987_28401 [Smallanthus sonchifolius]
MKYIISLLFILQAIINCDHFAIAQNPMRDTHRCRGGDFKSNIQKIRDSALDKLLALLKKNSSYNGFYHSQEGAKPEEQVSASFLCTPKVHSLCECCFKNVVASLRKGCPKQNEGVAWGSYNFNTCIVRYSTGRKILSVLDDWAWHSSFFPDDFVQAVELEKTVDSLASKLKEQAAGGDALKKYAQGSVNYDNDELSLFMVMQCTPDLTKGDCVKCLSKASVELRSCCTRKKIFIARVVSTNCYAWYSHVSFFTPPSRFDSNDCS